MFIIMNYLCLVLMIYLFFIRFRKFLFRFFLNREFLLNNYLIIIYITFFLYTYIVVKRHNKTNILIKNSPHKFEVIIIILLMILIYLHKKLHLFVLPLHILQSSMKLAYLSQNIRSSYLLDVE